jgi:hypothetical protein
MGLVIEKWRWRSARDGEVGDDGEVEMELRMLRVLVIGGVSVDVYFSFCANGFYVEIAVMIRFLISYKYITISLALAPYAST